MSPNAKLATFPYLLNSCLDTKTRIMPAKGTGDVSRLSVFFFATFSVRPFLCSWMICWKSIRHTSASDRIFVDPRNKPLLEIPPWDELRSNGGQNTPIEPRPRCHWHHCHPILRKHQTVPQKAQCKNEWMLWLRATVHQRLLRVLRVSRHSVPVYLVKGLLMNPPL